MTRSLYVLLFMLPMMICVSCNDKEAPENLIEEDVYIKIFSQLVIINQMQDEQLDDISREYLIGQVYEEYDVTEDQFNQSHQYYQRQPDQQLERINQIEEKFKLERDEFQERLNEERRVMRDTTADSDTL